MKLLVECNNELYVIDNNLFINLGTPLDDNAKHDLFINYGSSDISNLGNTLSINTIFGSMHNISENSQYCEFDLNLDILSFNNVVME